MRSVASIAREVIILLLITLWPFFSVYAQHIHEGSQFGDLLGSFRWTFLVALCLYVPLKALQRKLVGFLTALLIAVVSFMNFSALAELGVDLPPFLLNSLWVLLTVTLCTMGFLLLRSHPSGEALLFFVLAALYLAPAWQYAMHHYYESRSQRLGARTSVHESPQAAMSRKPNVYHIVLDGFPRADVSERLYSYDMSEFVKKLQSHGFYVADRATANFPFTWTSLPTTLQWEYVLAAGENVVGRAQHWSITRGKNRTSEFFKAHGYRYVHYANQHWRGSDCGDKKHVDLCLSLESETRFSFSETQNAFLHLTPLEQFVERFLGYKNRNASEEDVDLRKIAHWVETNRIEGPFYFFTHLLMPHPPDDYRDDCSISHAREELRKWNLETLPFQLSCGGRDLIRVIEAIERYDRTGPVIIVQADHGPATRNQFAVPVEKWSSDDILERYGVLNAIKMESRCRRNLYPTMSLVNTYRVVTACLLGEEPELLGDMSYLVKYDSKERFAVAKRVAVLSGSAPSAVTLAVP